MSQKWTGTNLIVQVSLGFKGQGLVVLPGQHVGPDADGEVAGVHLADLRVLADQVQHGDQVPEKQEVGPRQLVGHPGIECREESLEEAAGCSGFSGAS